MGWRAIRSPLLRGILAASVPGMGIALSGPAVAAFSPPAQLAIVTDDNYPPFLFRDTEGRLQGILKDKWELWSRKTGIPVVVDGTAWADAQARVGSGGADVIEALAYTDARAGTYEYSPSYATIDARVYFHRSISGINDAASMRGFSIGAKEGSACAAWLAARGIDMVRRYPNSEALVKAAGAGETRLFCMDAPTAQYFLFKEGLADTFRETAPLYSARLHWAVARGRTELRDFVQQGFGRISARELEDIDARWLGNPLKLQMGSRYFYYLATTVAAVLAGATLLLSWNRTLQRRVSARTADLADQKQVLELIARGAPLKGTLDTLLRLVELRSNGMLSSILLLDDDGLRLRHAAAPNLPEGFKNAIDGQPIGERAGSCGTAAFTHKPVVVEDVLVDPLWAGYRDIAQAHGLRSCWSTPIYGAQRRLLGTFALYFREPRRPTRWHQRLIEMTTHLAAIAIDKKREEDALRESAARLQRLSRHLVDTQETERRAISRELHDRIGQNLSALNLSLGLVRRQLPEDFLQKMRGRFDDAQGLLESTVQQVRNVMADLRPAVLDDYGLAAALAAFAKPFGERLGIPVAVLGELQPRPSIAVETALFRIAQEALNNVGKHARARNVVVKLETRPAGLLLTVDDDGVGFEPARSRAGAPTYGVITMRERAEAVGADLRIESLPGQGTRVMVEVASARA